MIKCKLQYISKLSDSSQNKKLWIMKNVSDYQVGKDTGENTTQQTNRNF